METYTCLIQSFYQSVREDISEIAPDLDLVRSWTWLDQKLHEDPIRVIQELSALGKKVESCLINKGEMLIFSDYFEKWQDENELPGFLNPVFQRVFYSNGSRRFLTRSECGGMGSIYVLILRQVLLAFSKLQDVEPVVDKQDEIDTFCLRVSEDHYPNSFTYSREIGLTRRILRDLFYGEDGDGEYRLNPSVEQWIADPFGRHGPGAVAGKETGVQKWWFKPVEGLDPQIYNLRTLTGLEREAYKSASFENVVKTSRLAVVPKDFRGHRLICIEPKELMFAQQGLMQILTDVVHDHPVARRSIDFKDQSKSMDLCNKTRYSTLDLKDASDRITLRLLRDIFPKEVFALLTRYRSRMITLPDGDMLSPTTAFTMGNALCFPVETIVFWASSLSSMLLQYADDKSDYAWHVYAQLKAHPRGTAARDLVLRVFGDDIIVPKKYYDTVSAGLNGLGMMINRAKSCNETPVREACGAWWFDGQDVRITRFSFHNLNRKYLAWVSVAENAKELAQCGFTHTSRAICEALDKLHQVPWGRLGFPMPKNIGTKMTLEQIAQYGTTVRYNIQLQRVEVLVPVIKDDGPTVHLRDSEGIYAYYTRQATRLTTQRGSKTTLEWTAAPSNPCWRPSLLELYDNSLMKWIQEVDKATNLS